MRALRLGGALLASLVLLTALVPAALAAGSITVSETNFGFGSHVVGTTSKAHSFTITNHTDSSVSLASVSNSDPADFS